MAVFPQRTINSAPSLSSAKSFASLTASNGWRIDDDHVRYLPQTVQQRVEAQASRRRSESSIRVNRVSATRAALGIFADGVIKIAAVRQVIREIVFRTFNTERGRHIGIAAILTVDDHDFLSVLAKPAQALTTAVVVSPSDGSADMIIVTTPPVWLPFCR